MTATKSTKQAKSTGKAVGAPKSGTKSSNKGYQIFKEEIQKAASKEESKVIEPHHSMSRRKATHVKGYSEEGAGSSEDDETKALEASARKAWKKLSAEEKQRYAELVSKETTSEAHTEKKISVTIAEAKSKRAVGSKTKAVTSKAKSPKAGKASTKAAAEGDEPLNTPPREDASSADSQQEKSVSAAEMDMETAAAIHQQ